VRWLPIVLVLVYAILILVVAVLAMGELLREVDFRVGGAKKG